MTYGDDKVDTQGNRMGVCHSCDNYFHECDNRSGGLAYSGLEDGNWIKAYIKAKYGKE